MSSSSLACITSGACFAGSRKGWTLSPVAPAVSCRPGEPSGCLQPQPLMLEVTT